MCLHKKAPLDRKFKFNLRDLTFHTDNTRDLYVIIKEQRKGNK